MTGRSSISRNLPPSIEGFEDIAPEILKVKNLKKHPQTPVTMSATSNNNVLKELYRETYSLRSISSKPSKLPPPPCGLFPNDLTIGNQAGIFRDRATRTVEVIQRRFLPDPLHIGVLMPEPLIIGGLLRGISGTPGR